MYCYNKYVGNRPNVVFLLVFLVPSGLGRSSLMRVSATLTSLQAERGTWSFAESTILSLVIFVLMTVQNLQGCWHSHKQGNKCSINAINKGILTSLYSWLWVHSLFTEKLLCVTREWCGHSYLMKSNFTSTSYLLTSLLSLFLYSWMITLELVGLDKVI